MTTAQFLRQEGRQQGRQEGQWIGKVQLLQKLMGFAVSSDAELGAMTLDELQSAFAGLEEAYAQQFKAPTEG